MMREAARWISELGLVPGSSGGFVGAHSAGGAAAGPERSLGRSAVSGQCAEGSSICGHYVLLTEAAPRLVVADDRLERLCFHHAGGIVRVIGDGAAVLGPPRSYQGIVAGGDGRGLELASGGWALLSVAVGGARAAVFERAGAQGGAAGEGGRLIAELGLRPHVEGGYFGEVWRSAECIATPRGERALASTIYYLLTADSPVGKFHRNASDITHFYHAGGPIEYGLIDPAGEWHDVPLAAAFTCPGGWWKSSRLVGAQYGLISEIVVPGFDWADQEMGTRAQFERWFPRHRARWARRVL